MTSNRETQEGGLKKWQLRLDKFLRQSVAKNIGYLVFYSMLAVIYIANNNKATLMIRELNQQQHALKELKWKHTDLQAQLMGQTSESELIKLSEKIGLQQLEHPVFEIRVSKENIKK